MRCKLLIMSLFVNIIAIGCSCSKQEKIKNSEIKKYTVKTLYLLSLDTKYDKTVDENRITAIGKRIDYPKTKFINVDGIINDIKPLNDNITSVDLRIFMHLTSPDGSNLFVGINKFGNWGILNGNKISFEPTKRSEVKEIIEQFD